jgi:hypothetical protein
MAEKPSHQIRAAENRIAEYGARCTHVSDRRTSGRPWRDAASYARRGFTMAGVTSFRFLVAVHFTVPERGLFTRDIL